MVSTSNYCTVHAASVNAHIQPRKSDGDVDNACDFLKAGAKVRKSAEEDTAKAIMMMVNNGSLEYNHKEMTQAVGNQASLVVAKHCANYPPAHGARDGLSAKMKVLEHPKGPPWIWKNGMDVNLDSSVAKCCLVNNGLISIQEDKTELGEDDVIQVASVVGGAKGKKRVVVPEKDWIGSLAHQIGHYLCPLPPILMALLSRRWPRGPDSGQTR